MAERGNRFLRALRRLASSTAELDSEKRVEVAMKPRSGTPWLEAEFSDGSGVLTLIWMGRRAIPGVTAGRELVVTGRVSDVDGQRRLYNPWYQLV